MTESPNHPQSPASLGQAPAPPRPGTIEGAFWAFIAAPVIGLIGGLLIFADRDRIAAGLRDTDRQRGGNLTDAQLDQVVTVTMITAVVIAVVIAGLYLLFAFKLRAGRNWARIVLTVLAALQLLSVLTGQSTIGGYVAVLAAVVGVVLSFTGPSNAFFAAAKGQR
ncbi:hypothetical protein [Amycolatopsis sp. MtRt-6]|uniref:hypothetical protein n=1 Tax=Amycolatopsis sp. MtRt-6 TaxID=2792782 RepID=UPI001A8DA885|nr:hypothetical protein [Amycolatopsis sp. MtRt-6]